MSEVTCPRCNRANPSNHFFCTECGANLRITDVEGRERQSLARELESVRWQLNGASRELDRLQVRISRLEGGPAIPPSLSRRFRTTKRRLGLNLRLPSRKLNRQTSRGTGRPFPKGRPTGSMDC